MAAASVTRRRVLDAMRSGEWLRTQWIARVVEGLGDRPWRPGAATATLHALRALVAEGVVERRAASERREGDVAGLAVAFSIPRAEWRLMPSE
jgi:hypothetical protein